uniref:Uncharacterized protein n=2 Tax=Alexandrium monilatum TaxID=311494 RepID=A0A7S4T0E2_9DINO|mmetsp:Transcript_30706/g.91197  ORF Transcript_30706/g.91197 Transcript_30706/m.91197 type:complete len:117 (-) Transcript_30706:88-438(-)
MEYVIGWRWLYAYWPGPLVDEVERAWDTPMWPDIARPDWSWEGLKFCVPPYYVPEDGLPWRRGRDAEHQPIRVTKGKGKGRGRALGDSRGRAAAAAPEEAARGEGGGDAQSSEVVD